MASNRGAFSLLCSLVICVAYSSQVEGRESVFFSKMKHPVRRYNQLVSSSLPALTPLPSAAPAPAPSQVAPTASENYVYGFYGEEVGEFPVATSKASADETAHKTSGADDDFKNDSLFFTQDDNLGYGGSNSNTRYNRYQDDDDDDDEYGSNNNALLSRHPNLYQNSYSNNKDVDNYDDDTRSYNDDMYSTMYNSNYNTDEYTNGGENYNSDRSRARRFGDNGRNYNDNGDGYYRDNESPNEFNSMEEYEGVYQP